MRSRALSSPECAHRNRPLGYDGQVVVTLCADDVLYLPVTTEITSLPQITPEGLPLALARRAAEQTRMVKAVAELEAHGEAVTSRSLAEAARISLNTACTWLRQHEIGAMEPPAALSVLHYSSSSVSDNIPTVEEIACTELPGHTAAAADPTTAASSAPEGEQLLSAVPVACLAASHQLLWSWRAGTWQCPACGG